MAIRIQWIDEPTRVGETYQLVAFVDIQEGFTPTSQLIGRMPYPVCCDEKPELLGKYRFENSFDTTNWVALWFAVEYSTQTSIEEAVTEWCDRFSVLTYGLTFQDVESIRYGFNPMTEE